MPSDQKRCGKRPKKCTFHVNRYTKQPRINSESISQLTDSECSVSVCDNSSDLQDLSSSDASKAVAMPLSRSEKKLSNIYDLPSDSCTFDNEESVSDDEDSDTDLDQELEGYRLIDLDILNRNVMTQVSCKYCGGGVKLFEVERKGLGSRFTFLCSNRRCDEQQTFPSCPLILEGNVSVYSVNRRSALAMRCIGGDRQELVTFCGIMNLPRPVNKSSFNCINKTMHKACCSVQEQSMRNAAQIEYDLAEDLGDQMRNCAVSVDGMYMTRGHTSNMGVSTAIGLESLIWKFCPKTKHHGLVVVEIAVATAVCIFNDGCSLLGDILKAMGLDIGQHSRHLFSDKDTYCIITAQRETRSPGGGGTVEMPERKFKQKGRVSPMKLVVTDIAQLLTSLNFKAVDPIHFQTDRDWEPSSHERSSLSVDELLNVCNTGLQKILDRHATLIEEEDKMSDVGGKHN